MAHILVLEPDGLLAGSIAGYLATGGHTVAAHKDPQQAVISADQNLPDVVVTELQLAGRSGVEFLYELRSYPDWQSIPVIIFTNLSPEQTGRYQEALGQLNAGLCLYKKTTGLEQLASHIQQALIYAEV